MSSPLSYGSGTNWKEKLACGDASVQVGHEWPDHRVRLLYLGSHEDAMPHMDAFRAFAESHGTVLNEAAITDCRCNNHTRGWYSADVIAKQQAYFAYMHERRWFSPAELAEDGTIVGAA